jgi:hypothetical protein
MSLGNRRDEEMAEATRSDSDTARTIFYVTAVLMAIYGLALLLFPQAMFALSEDPGVPAKLSVLPPKADIRQRIEHVR